MNKIDAWLILASIILFFSMLVYLNHTEQRLNDWFVSPAHIIEQENRYVCQPEFEQQTAGEVLIELRLLNKFMQTFEP
jgi:hypothetical protein